MWLIPLLMSLPLITAARIDCSKDTYDGCVRIADPLVKEPHLIFPDNMEDIDLVCRTWNRFVDCLKLYTDSCFTDQQKKQFNKAVENPIESIHQMCTQSNYQKEYLLHAPCIKSTITEQSHCGSQYSLLVDQVSQGEVISKSTLCCSHDRFKQCVDRETRRLCDRGVPNGAASRFSGQIIDKALSFLQDQCYNYIPNSGDCNTPTTDAQAFSDPFTISTSSSEVYPWSTVQEAAAAAPKEIFPSRSTNTRVMTTTAWLPSSNLPIQRTAETTSQTLGSRSRPASYGRANTWSTESPRSTTVGSTARAQPDWATVTNWRPQTGGGSTDPNRGTTWYPAAGDQLTNEVDEPNQQGLTKPKNSGVKGVRVLLPLVVIAVLGVAI